MFIDQKFVSCDTLSVRLGIPLSWIKSETNVGRIPHIICGRSKLYNVKDVESYLIDLSHKNMKKIEKESIKSKAGCDD